MDSNKYIKQVNNFGIKCFKKLKQLTENNEFFKFILQFLFIAFFYGLIISIMMTSLFEFGFSINTIFAFGILYYLIKVELPPIIHNCLAQRGD